MRRDPILCVLGELVVDLLPVPRPDAGPEGTAPQYVARPGGNALNVAVAAGRLGAPVRLLARLGTGPLGANLRRHAELSGVDPPGFVAAAEPVSLAVVGLARRLPRLRLPRPRRRRLAVDRRRARRGLPRPDRDPARRLHLQLDGARLRRDRAARRPRRGQRADQRRSQHPADAGRGSGRREPGNTAPVVRERLDRLVARPTSSRSAPRTWSGWTGRARRRGWTPPRGDGPTAGRPSCCSPTAASRCGSPARGVPFCTASPPRDGGRHGRGRRLARRRSARRPARRRCRLRPALAALPDETLLRLVDDAALIAALNCTRVGADPPTRAEFEAARSAR